MINSGGIPRKRLMMGKSGFLIKKDRNAAGAGIQVE